tara:strand:- start:31731 stop:34049 length:2319 start_codon:yes stop_codon:yes gene_type:complete
MYKKPTPLSSRNKPLPSPPIAQVIDPNSPPKAQRTLVDAEAGTPTDEDWPIIRPEKFSPIKKASNHTESEPERQQEQRRSVSEVSSPPQSANILVENRPLTASASFEHRSASKSSRQSEQTTVSSLERQEPSIGARRFSSNNPYGKAFHAYSPNADVAMSSPLARKSSAPLKIRVPPRLSSKRASLPLLHPDEPRNSPQGEPHDLMHSSDHWPLHRSEHADVSAGRSDDGLPEERNTTTTIDAAQLSASMDAEVDSLISNTSLANDNAVPEDTSINPSSYDPETGYRTKILSERNRSPVSSVHKDAHALSTEEGEVSEDESDLPDKHAENTPLGRSLDAPAHRMSKQNTSALNPEQGSDAPIPVATPTGVEKFGSVKISPLRNFAPQRQVSARLPPWSPSSRPMQSSNVDRSPHFPSAPDVAAPDAVRVEAPSAPELDSERPSSAHIGEVHEATDADAAEIAQNDDGAVSVEAKGSPESPLKKAKKVLGLGRVGASRKRLTPSWMAPTISSMKSKRASIERRKASSPRKIASRMSNRDVASSATSPGSASPTSRRPAQSNEGTRRQSKLRTSMNAAPATEHPAGAISVSKSTQTGPEQLAQSSTPSPKDTDKALRSEKHNNDAPKKSATLKIKAKRSFRSMFSKVSTTSVEKMPPVPDPKRASIATTSKTLAKRISKNFSKAPLPTAPEHRSDVRSALEAQDTTTANDAEMHDITASPEGTLSNPAPGNQLAVQSDLTTVIAKLDKMISSMSKDDPEHVRLVQMAEVCCPFH